MPHKPYVFIALNQAFQRRTPALRSRLEKLIFGKLSNFGFCFFDVRARENKVSATLSGDFRPNVHRTFSGGSIFPLGKYQTPCLFRSAFLSSSERFGGRLGGRVWGLGFRVCFRV